MGKNNSALDLASLGFASDDSSEVSGEKKSRIGGKQGAYMRVNALIEAAIARHEETGEDNVVEALRTLQKDCQRTKEETGVPQGTTRHYIGEREDGTLESFDSVSTPTTSSHTDFVRVYGPYRKTAGLSFRLENGIPSEEKADRLVCFRAA